MPPPRVTLTFILLSFKVVSESRVQVTCVLILIFLGLRSQVIPNVRDRQTSDKSIA